MCHKEALKKYQNYTYIARKNTKSILCTFDDFHLILNKSKFDIIAPSRIWLKDNHHQLVYTKIPAYKSIFRNCRDKEGSEVSFYITETIPFNIRNE